MDCEISAGDLQATSEDGPYLDDGSTIAPENADDVLPETLSLIRDSRTVLISLPALAAGAGTIVPKMAQLIRWIPTSST